MAESGMAPDEIKKVMPRCYRCTSIVVEETGPSVTETAAAGQ
jgi:hypothetical protein